MVSLSLSLSLSLLCCFCGREIIGVMGKRRSGRWEPANAAYGWVAKQSVRMKMFLGVAAGLLTLVVLKLSIDDMDYFYIISEAVHGVGIISLIYKLTRHKNCSGLSLKSQELTATFIAIRMLCNVLIEESIHIFLDFTTLLSTLWVIYMIRFKLSSSYSKELDIMPRYYLVVPSLVLSILIHPRVDGFSIIRFHWAFCVYLESVSVLPQLQLIQNAKMVEPFTAHYVFALGVARFFSFAHWILMIIESRGSFLYAIGYGSIWIGALLVAEIVQTFILADFCYYYVKSCMFGNLNIVIPSAV